MEDIQTFDVGRRSEVTAAHAFLCVLNGKEPASQRALPLQASACGPVPNRSEEQEGTTLPGVHLMHRLRSGVRAVGQPTYMIRHRITSFPPPAAMHHCPDNPTIQGILGVRQWLSGLEGKILHKINEDLLSSVPVPEPVQTKEQIIPTRGSRPVRLTRRVFVYSGLAAFLSGCGAGKVLEPRNRPTDERNLPPTPACGDDPTPAQTAGPYFTPNSPERASLLEAGTGTRLLLAGTVVTRSCKPVRRALLDFWQADEQGRYDNQGYRYRGHLYTDEAGRFSLETVLPGLYPGRTRHLHVRVQAPGGPVLTTQLYFPGEAANASDPIFRKELTMQLREEPDGKAGQFQFVLDLPG